MVPWLGGIDPRASTERSLLLQVSASKMRAGVGSLFWLRIERRRRKRIEGDCTKVMKESYKIESKKGQTKEAVLKPFVRKKEMTVDHRVPFLADLFY